MPHVDNHMLPYSNSVYVDVIDRYFAMRMMASS